MKKLMMMVAACAAMMGATASAAEVTSMWLDKETGKLCITSSPDLGSILGYDDEIYEISLGTTNRYGFYSEDKVKNFPVMSHTSDYEYSTVSYYHGPKSWDEVFDLYTDGRVYICHKGDHGVDSETTIRVSQLAWLFKDDDGIWQWRGNNGSSGVIGTEAPVVEPEDEPIVEPEPEDEPEQKQTKCPVLSFFRKLFKR